MDLTAAATHGIADLRDDERPRDPRDVEVNET